MPDAGTQTSISSVAQTGKSNTPKKGDVFSPKSAAVALSTLFHHPSFNSSSSGRSSAVGSFQERLNNATAHENTANASSASKQAQLGPTPKKQLTALDENNVASSTKRSETQEQEINQGQPTQQQDHQHQQQTNQQQQPQQQQEQEQQQHQHQQHQQQHQHQYQQHYQHQYQHHHQYQQQLPSQHPHSQQQQQQQIQQNQHPHHYTQNMPPYLGPEAIRTASPPYPHPRFCCCHGGTCTNFQQNGPWAQPWNTGMPKNTAPPNANPILNGSNCSSNEISCGKQFNNSQFMPPNLTPSVNWDDACRSGYAMEKQGSSKTASNTNTSGVARLASSTSLVTPTPKKAKLADLAPKFPGGPPPGHPITSSGQPTPARTPYSRKKKSLGVLAENFLNKYEGSAPGTEVIVDEAAVELGVERRRIYDVVNILESVQLVVKKGKNTYTWLGKEFLSHIFGRIQSQALLEYPQDAIKNGLITEIPRDEKPSPSLLSDDSADAGKDAGKDNKSLAKLSQQFLQVFLVGHDILSLPQASDKIQGTTSVEDLAAIGSSTSTPSDPKEFRAAAARGLKTKIRRLYDIANVFLSVGLLRKTDSCGGHMDSTSTSRRPNFQWAFHLSPKEIMDMYSKSKKACSSVPGPPFLPTSATFAKNLPVPIVAKHHQVIVPQKVNSRSHVETATFIPKNVPVTTDERTPLKIIDDNAAKPSKEILTDSKSHVTPTIIAPIIAKSQCDTASDKPPQTENDSSRVILANIHQTGGAWDSENKSMGAVPTLARTVTLTPAQNSMTDDTLYI